MFVHWVMRKDVKRVVNLVVCLSDGMIWKKLEKWADLNVPLRSSILVSFSKFFQLVLQLTWDLDMASYDCTICGRKC